LGHQIIIIKKEFHFKTLFLCGICNSFGSHGLFQKTLFFEIIE
jgi:hypothetical protein